MSETDASPSAVAEQLYAAFGAGDIDTVIGLLDPGVTWELVGPAEIPYFGRYEGIDGARRFFSLLGEHCVVERFEVHRVVGTETGAIAEGFERGHFAGREARYDMRWCHVFTVRDGLITSFTDYLDTAPMLAAWRS